MLRKHEKNILLLLDVIEMILSLIVFFLFTLIFRFDTSVFRYFFLFGDCYVICFFYKVLSSFAEKMEGRRIVKNSKSLIDAKYLKKISYYQN